MDSIKSSIFFLKQKILKGKKRIISPYSLFGHACHRENLLQTNFRVTLWWGYNLRNCSRSLRQDLWEDVNWILHGEGKFHLVFVVTCCFNIGQWDGLTPLKMTPSLTPPWVSSCGPSNPNGFAVCLYPSPSSLPFLDNSQDLRWALFITVCCLFLDPSKQSFDC